MTKQCTKCKKTKSLTDFHRMSSTSDGFRPSCKECRSADEKKRFSRPEVKQKVKIGQLKYLYNMSPSDYENMTKKQDNRCAICNIKPKQLVIDHCHKTKTVRSLLCSRCNLAIGHIKDNIDVAKSIVNYLQTHNK